MKWQKQSFPSNPELWHRILGALLPITADGRGFDDHLAEITGLTRAGARAVELEYRRFLYLAAITEAPREPPGLVRVAWSFHTGLDGYGEDFCRWVLGRTLRFTPAPHAPKTAYAATFAAYRAEFGTVPPATIWPSPTAQMTMPFAGALQGLLASRQHA